LLARRDTKKRRSSCPDASLDPPFERVREISRRVAVEVALEAHRAGLAQVTHLDDFNRTVTEKMWEPPYVSLKRSAS
jgi:hypothetical protein